MAKKLIILAAVVALLAPASVFAHAGHEHGEAAPKQPDQAAAPAPLLSNQTQTALIQENEFLKKELEKEKLRADKKIAEVVTDMSATRSSYIIIGLIFGVIGLVIRYFPEKEQR